MKAALEIWRAMPRSERIAGFAVVFLFWPLLALIAAALPN